MFDAILNKIAERSQALKDKDAEIAVWQAAAMEQEKTINTLVESANGEPVRNLNLRARAEAAELQLAQIAEALNIEHVIQAGADAGSRSGRGSGYQILARRADGCRSRSRLARSGGCGRSGGPGDGGLAWPRNSMPPSTLLPRP